MGNLILKEQSVSGFTAAPLNKIKIAYGNDDNLYRIDDANNAVVIGGGGGSQTLAQTLALGNTSGAYDILINTGQRIGLKDGDDQYTTYLSNDITTAANRTVYLPLFDGQLAYHATGTPPTTNYVLKGTTNGAITSSSLIYDNGTNVGIGTASPSYKLQINTALADFDGLQIKNTSTNAAAGAYLLFTNGNGANAEIVLKQGSSFAGYGAANDMTFRAGVGAAYMNFVSESTNGFRFYPSAAGGASLATLTPTLAITGTERVGFGIASPTAKAHIVGSTSGSTAYALKVDNSSSSALLYVRNDNKVSVGGDVAASTRFHIRGGTSDNTEWGIQLTNSSTTNIFSVLNSGEATIRSTNNNGTTTPLEVFNSTPATMLKVGDNFKVAIGTATLTETLRVGSNAIARNYVHVPTTGGDLYIGTENYAWFGQSAGTLNVVVNNGAPLAIGTYTNYSLIFGTTNATRGSIDLNGNWILTNNGVATNAVNGFTYIPSCAGTPTGTPTAITGAVPLVADSTNNKIYAYLGGAWTALN